MYVVVYLCDAKKNVVVPQKFIFGLSQPLLNNYGKQRTKKFLIFWSPAAFSRGEDEEPNLEFIPNFKLNISSIWTPEEEACYIGQIRYFFGKYMC